MTSGLALLQELYGVSLPHFFAGLFLILTLYCGAFLFTYWISKDE
jgi:hypothetical protein